MKIESFSSDILSLFLWRYAVAWTDVCIINDNEFLLLLLQEVRRLTSTTDQEPQVISEAIAAFALNNRKREYCSDLFLVIPSCFLASQWLAPCRSSTKLPSLPSPLDRHLSRDRKTRPSLHFHPSSQEQFGNVPPYPIDSRSCDALRHSKISWYTKTGMFP